MSSMPILRLLAGLFFVFLSLPAAAQQEDLLQAEEAFRFSVERNADQQIQLRWEIEEGYYLYRDHLEAKDAATGEPIPLENLRYWSAELQEPYASAEIATRRLTGQA